MPETPSKLRPPLPLVVLQHPQESREPLSTVPLIGDSLGVRDFFAGVLFPIVILTMLVERFTIAIAEEGPREAFVPLAWSLLVAVAIHPVFRNAFAEHAMFTFPELCLAVMGGLVWIGGYTGYRVSDLLRFRALAAAEGARG